MLASTHTGAPIARFLERDQTPIRFVTNHPDDGHYSRPGGILLDRALLDGDPREAASALAHEATHRMDDIEGRLYDRQQTLFGIPFGAPRSHWIRSEGRAYHNEAQILTELGVKHPDTWAGTT